MPDSRLTLNDSAAVEPSVAPIAESAESQVDTLANEPVNE